MRLDDDQDAWDELTKPEEFGDQEVAPITFKPGTAFAVGITTIVALMFAAATTVDHQSTAGKLFVGGLIIAVWAIIVGCVIWDDR